MLMRYYVGLGVGHAHVRLDPESGADWSFDLPATGLQECVFEEADHPETEQCQNYDSSEESQDSDENSCGSGLEDSDNSTEDEYTDDEESLALEEMYKF